ncbi:MAG: SDR family NAD(P)-dependent oxidoreductase [Promethearchaeota archaeon]
MGKLDGKVALVGGNLGKIKKDKFIMGLGGYIAKDLAEAGANVLIVDLDPKVTEECAKALGNEKIKPKQCDLLKDRTFETKKYVNERGEEKTQVVWTDNPALDLVKDIVEEFGHLDILVTNFDYFEKGKLEKFNEEFWVTMRENNLTPIFHLLAAVREQFAAQRKQQGTFAKVVMMTNIAGKAGLSMATVYSALKASIVSLVKSMAKEFGRFANVNGVAIAPLSDKNLQGPKDRMKKQFIAGIVATERSKIELKPKHITPLVTLLCSDDADGINGQIINIDGGLWLKLEQ